MVPSRGATEGMAIQHRSAAPRSTVPSRARRPRRRAASRSRATARNVTNRTTSAAMMPIISAGPGRSVPSARSAAHRRTRPARRPPRPARRCRAARRAWRGRARRSSASNCTAANAVVPSGEIDRGLASGSVTPTTRVERSRPRPRSSRDRGGRPAVGDRRRRPRGTRPSRWPRRARGTAPPGGRPPACDSTPGTSKSSTVPPPATRFAATRPITTANHTSTTRRRWCTATQRPNRYEHVRHDHLLTTTTLLAVDCIFAISAALLTRIVRGRDRPGSGNGRSASGDAGSRMSPSTCSNDRGSTRPRSSRSPPPPTSRPGRSSRTSPPRTTSSWPTTPTVSTASSPSSSDDPTTSRRGTPCSASFAAVASDYDHRGRPTLRAVSPSWRPHRRCTPGACSSRPGGSRRSASTSRHGSRRRRTTPPPACSLRQRSPSCERRSSTGSPAIGQFRCRRSSNEPSIGSAMDCVRIRRCQGK